ncbi:MAG: 50S ribosomal protein L29 [Leptospiraceae bacterium]|nr:50S ribosomal protein L29 [Leptospiraceae bacterium]MDW7975179.1 50S ribosomal protein L29 [Leptospiraceae bacterium]
MKKKSNFHSLTDEELHKQLKQKKEELLKMRFSFGVSKVMKNPAQYRKTKRDIARILTILRKRELQKSKA